MVERGKTFGIASKKSRLEKVSKFLGIRGPIIISELIIFSLLDISKILFNEFSVSKTFKLDHIMPLINNGHTHYGENKVQEASDKWTKIKKENKNNPDFMKIANENDRLAIRMEDDPYQWWVSKQPIDLEGLNYQVAMSNWLREMLENEPEGATN